MGDQPELIVYYFTAPATATYVINGEDIYLNEGETCEFQVLEAHPFDIRMKIEKKEEK